MRGILTIVLRESDQATLEKTLRDFLVGKVPKSQIAPQLRLWTSSAFRTAMSYDPGPELKEIMCPVLALYAEKDFTVPAKLNVPAMRAALAANKAGEVEELPNALALTLAQPVAPAEVEERGEEENFCRYTGSSNSGWMRRLHDFGMLPAPGDCQSVAAMVEVCSAISGSRSLERRS
jgi:hypothetical protein